LLLLVSYYSSASVIMFYDRAEWELAANAMGLEVSTNDFSSPPLLFSPPPTDLFDPTGRFTIKETSWNILGGTVITP